MLAHTATIKKLGMTFDYDQVAGAESRTDSQEIFINECVTSVRMDRDRTEITFRFKTGDSMTLINPEMEIRRIVDLEIGKIYHVGDGKRKWLGICVEDEDIFADEDGPFKQVVPLMPDSDYPTIDDDERMDYEFYKEFDLDLREYL